MNTTTRIPEGARVLYIGGGDEHQPDLVGKLGTVQRDDKTDYIPYYVEFDSGNYPRWWCPRQALIHVPAIGDKVIPVNGDTVGIPVEYRNAVGTVSGVLPADGDTRARIVAEFQSYQKPDDSIEWSFYEWKPADGHTLTVSSDEGIRAAAQEEIETLRRELDRANERVEEFRTRAGKWERDFMRYAERVMQEAIDRDWCSQYEEVVDDIRGNLEIATIPDREVEVDIEWEETYTVTVRRSGTVTLTSGYGEYEIEQAARDLNGNSDADRSEVLDAVRNGNYESCDFVDDSAQEA